MLLTIDSCVLVLYSLSLSIWALLTFGEAFDPAATMQLEVDLRDIVLELNGALSIAFGWCIGGAIGGACDREWVELDADEHAKAPFGVAKLLRAWLIAAPIALGVKTLGVAAVILPLGGSVGFWGPGIVLDGVGMLAVRRAKFAIPRAALFCYVLHLVWWSTRMLPLIDLHSRGR